jgi:hypothetical protein
MYIVLGLVYNDLKIFITKRFDFQPINIIQTKKNFTIYNYVQKIFDFQPINIYKQKKTLQ